MKEKTTENSRILVIDDNETQVMYIKYILTSQGYQSSFALSGETALADPHLSKYNLILLDISLPGINGFEVCNRLKNSLDTKDIPVIFMSARQEILDKVTAFEVGGVDYITKPFDNVDLVKRVKKLVGE